MKILAIDPGGTTGLCMGSVEFSQPFIRTRAQVPQGDYPHLWRVLGSYNADVVVCESFTAPGSKAINTGPAEVIGVVKLWCLQRGVQLHFQKSAQMGFWSDDKLKELKLYIAGQRHSTDATSHWLYFVTFTLGHDNYLKELKSPPLRRGAFATWYVGSTMWNIPKHYRH